jgi:C_GCAxxG_C_C family probable redox protein
MDYKKMRMNADQKMQGSCNCCEAVYWSYLETSAVKVPAELTKVASIFGGGIASSREEICGALTGALLVLSLCEGRDVESVPNEALMEKGAALRNEFIRCIGPTKCIDLRTKMMNEQGVIDCRTVVKETINLLSEIEIKEQI